MKLNASDKIFLIYLTLLFIFLFSTFSFNSLLADEGTHLLLSIFYRDLITHMLQTKDFSFQNAYQYGINYLIHYPKLQIAYPPLYHLTTAFAFHVFNVSETIGRTINLLYASGSFILFYLIIRKFFNPRVALLATFLFSFSPFSLFFASRAMQDFAMFFFLLLSVYIFSITMKYLDKISKPSLLFFLAGFSAFLAAMGKQMGGFVIFFFLIILASEFIKQKKNRKPIAINTLLLFLAFFLPLLAYLIILNAVGGFEINKLVAIGYAGEQGEPTSLLDPYFWLWYPINASISAPLTPIILLTFIWFVYKKEKYWKPLLVWFFLFFIALTLIPNKEPRFFQLSFLSAYAACGSFLEKLIYSRKRRFFKQVFAIVFLMGYFIVSLSIFIPTIQYYPSKELSRQIFYSLPKGANIALFSEADPLFSSVVMWHTRTLDKDTNVQIFRACMFDNKTKEEILKIIKDNNIHTIIYQTWNPNSNIEKIKNELRLAWSVKTNNLTTEIYTVKEFVEKPRGRICNYICLTKKEMCVKP